MADKITKLLAKLPPKDLRFIRAALEQLISGNLEGLDIKAMKGHENLYRVRAGNYRIIFRTGENEIDIVLIARRNEKTYRNF